MPYNIREWCVGCTICAKKCPVPCIWGDEIGKKAEAKEMHYIDPAECIDCGVCASYCPVDCIENQFGVIEKKIDKNRPIAIVQEENCTGCEWCVDVCPFDCLEMVPISEDHGAQMSRVARNVREKDCVGCKLCEEACVQKNAIIVVYPNTGEHAEDLGVETTLENPLRF